VDAAFVSLERGTSQVRERRARWRRAHV